jgi:hypothetical protein
MRKNATNPKILFIFSEAKQFIPLAGSTAKTGFCTPYMVLTDDGDGSVKIHGQRHELKIAGKTYQAYPSHGPKDNPTTLLLSKDTTATFCFTVIDDCGSPVAYFLSGLAAQRMASSGNKNAQPALSVSVDSHGATILSVVDDNDTRHGSSSTYDFWVMVQNTGGDVGLIDPLITNQS